MSLGEVAVRSFTDLDSTPHDGHVAALRRCQRCPAAGGAFAFAAAPPGVGDCLVSRKCRTFGPRGVKVVLFHSVSHTDDPRRVIGLVDPEPSLAGAFTDGVGSAEEPRC